MSRLIVNRRGAFDVAEIVVGASVVSITPEEAIQHPKVQDVVHGRFAFDHRRDVAYVEGEGGANSVCFWA